MAETSYARKAVLLCSLVMSCNWMSGCYEADVNSEEPGRVAQRSSALSGQGEERMLCEFAAYGAERADIRDRAMLGNGMVGSSSYVETGSSAQIVGSVESAGSVFLRGSYIDGDVTAGSTVDAQQGTTVTGTIRDHTAVAVVPVPTKTFDYGAENINLYSGQSLNLDPGLYGEVHVYSGATLTLRSGTYGINKFIIEASSATLRLDVGQGAIEINVEESLRIGNQLDMSLINGDDPRLVQIYTNALGQVSIGTDLDFYGQLTAPQAEVVVFSRTEVHGSIHSRRMVLEAEGRITGLGCEEAPPSEYPLGADTMTKTASVWWLDYHPDEVSIAGGLRFNIQNATSRGYTAVASIRLSGPQGTTWNKTLGESVLAPGASQSYTIPANELGLQSETSALQAQPEIVLKRIDMLGEITEERRLVPPIYYRHVPGAGFMQIELFDEATLISERGGRLAWGSGATVSFGDLLGYKEEYGLMVPIYAGHGERAKIFNELGEVVGYKLGSRLKANE